MPEIVRRLEAELGATKKQQQYLIEQIARSTEDLKVATEEVLSMNEELQSTNEELTTLNTQLHEKIHEVTAISDDLANLLVSASRPPPRRSLLCCRPTSDGRSATSQRTSTSTCPMRRASSWRT